MRVTELRLAPYGAFADRAVAFGIGLTVVLGANEAGKSTALDGLSDLLWGIPPQTARAFLHGRPALRLHGRIVLPDGGSSDVTRRSDGLYDAMTDTEVDVVWQGEHDSRDRWRRAFGLTHAELRRGGVELFDGEGDLAQLVFAARSGQGIRRLLERLRATADSLYRDNRNNKTALVRQASAEYARLREQVTAATSLASQVEAAARQLDEADRDLTVARRRAKAAGDRLRGCEARSRTADNARALHEHRTQADRVRAAGAVLTGSDLTTWTTATERLAAVDGELAPLRAELIELGDKQDSIDVDHVLLADGPEIHELHLACEARLVEGRQVEDALRHATAFRQTAAELVASLTGPCDTRSPAEILAALRVPTDLGAQLDELGRQLDDRAARVAKAREKFDSVAEERDSLATDAVDLDPKAVMEACEAIEADASAVVLRRDAVLRSAEAQRRRDECLTKAGLPGGVPPTGILPSTEEIDCAADSLESRNAEHKDAQRQLLRAERGLVKLRTELDTVDSGAVPTRDQLTEVRNARNQEVTRLVRAWLAGTPPESAADLPGTVDRVIAHADAIADRMVESVETVVRRTTLAAEVAKCSAEVEQLAVNVTTCSAEVDAAQQRWAALWRDLGRAPGRTDAKAFLEHLMAARSAEAEMSAKARLADDLREEVERQTATLAAALAQAGRERPGADPDSLVATAKQLLRESDDARETRALAAGAERRVKTADKALRAATASHDEALARWRAVSSAAGLHDDIDPVGWRHRQDVVRDATYAAHQADACQRDGTAAQQRYNEFVKRVTVLALRHDVAVDDAVTAIGELDTRRDTANTSHRNAEQLAKRIDALARKIEGKAAGRADVLTELEAMRAEYDVQTMAELDEAAARGRALAELGTEIGHLIELVRTAMPDVDLDELVSELAAADRDELVAAVEDATKNHQEAAELLDTAVDRRAQADQRYRTLAARTGAAQANAAAQSQLAVVEAHVERYLVAHFQRTVLRKELAAYERKHASSLLDEAGRLLERLTDGRYVGLRARHQGVGRSLTVVTADEVDHTPDQLSEGTADQVFLALRLAGIAALQDERCAEGLPTLPVVLDDVLMTFDDERSAAALRVVAELAQDWQVIVLSHHEHLADVVTSLGLPDVMISHLPPPEPLRPRRSPEDVRAVARIGDGQEADLPAAPSGRGRPAANSSDSDGASARDIRAWALKEGIELGERGRIPITVREAFHKRADG
jgi:uncharacterized protein YhaN